jgi:hypothetical protein
MQWVYAGSIVLRVGLLYSPGYIHPDEFFQAQEVAAIRRHSLDVPVAWEFDCRHPCRSSIMPVIAGSLPYAIVEMFGLDVSSRAMILAPRLVACTTVFILEWAAFRLAPLCNTPPQTVVFCLITSWPILLMHSRPFSNSFESAMLAILLVLWLAPPRALSKGSSALLWGALLCLGIFFRFTLIFFSLPLIVASIAASLPLYLRLQSLLPAVMLRPIWGGGNMRGAPPFVLMFLGALVTAGGMVALDSHFFASDFPCKALNASSFSILGAPPVFTPLNAILYNMKQENLAQHGLHPRVTHLLVNVPMLFGPLGLIAIYSCCSTVASLLEMRSSTWPLACGAALERAQVAAASSSTLNASSQDAMLPRAGKLRSAPAAPAASSTARSKSPGGRKRNSAATSPHSPPGNNSIPNTSQVSRAGYPECAPVAAADALGAAAGADALGARCIVGACAASGLLVLSCAPHQEPRFLLPMALPIALLYSTFLRAAAPTDPIPPSPSAPPRNAAGAPALSSTAAPAAAKHQEAHHSAPPTWRGVIPLPLWLIFNAVLLIFFGGFHQGGISRALHYLDGLPPANRSLLATHTYMPPVRAP